MINSENIESFCRNCVSRDFVSGRGLICKRTGSLPDFEEACSTFQKDEQLEAVAPTPNPEILSAALSREQLLAAENLPVGLLCGAIACVIGAVAWGVISVSTGYQMGYMAIGVGFLVGLAMRIGKGIRPIFGMIGAALALLSCVLGDYFSIVGYAAQTSGLSYMETLTNVPVADIASALIENLLSMTALFYGIAVYEGYKLSFSQQNHPKGGKI